MQSLMVHSVFAVKTYPDADCGSTYDLLMAKIRVKSCNINKTVPLKKFVITKILSTYAVGLKNRFEMLNTAEKMPDALWQII